MAAAQTADGLQLRKSDNSIPFKVDKDGDLTAASLTTAGALAAASAAITGDVATATVHASGAVNAGSAAVTGAVTAASLTTTGNVVAPNLVRLPSGKTNQIIQSGTFSVSFSNATSQNHQVDFAQAFSSTSGLVVVAMTGFASNADFLVALAFDPSVDHAVFRIFQKDGVNTTATVDVWWIAVGPA
jgi:hypothetical protein